MEDKTREEVPLPRKNILVELWNENREIIKDLLKHALFGLFIGSLTLLHEVLRFSSLPNDRKEALDKIHFYIAILFRYPNDISTSPLRDGKSPARVVKIDRRLLFNQVEGMAQV